MSKERKKKEKTRILRADYSLRQRVGSGTPDPETIKDCQKVIDENRIDFSPLGIEFLENLSQTIRQANSREISESDALSRMTDIIMQLKANASIFHYRLVGSLAQVMLGFLESLTHIDPGAVEIVDAHYKTLHAIIEKRMTGDGGEYGKKLHEELTHACERYERALQTKKQSKN